MNGVTRRMADVFRVDVLPLMVPRTWSDAAGALLVWSCLGALTLVVVA